MSEVRIVTPPGMFGGYANEAFLATAMRVIGVGFGEPGGWCAKYGANYENGVSMMHRYCWCEQPECLWCTIWLSNERDCTEEEAKAHRERHTQQVRDTYGEWAAKYPSAPHFWFKPSGFQLRWYKYIGRDMEANGELPSDFMEQVFASHPSDMTLAQALAETAKQEHETAERFSAMFAGLGIARAAEVRADPLKARTKRD